MHTTRTEPTLATSSVLNTYKRFPLEIQRGEGRTLWDTAGRPYLDMGGGIAVNCLGHAHPAILHAIREQSQNCIHLSNLYRQPLQEKLASELAGLIGPGQVFFSNSGAEANEGLYKLARRFGHPEGRFEIITTINSFHGRTLAGISATGQDKVKKGFDPMVAGFRHVPYNDLTAMEAAITPQTAAILIEGIQGEGGILPATPEYLHGLRELTRKHNLLLMMDSVQCGHFRTGRFQSYETILGSQCGEFLPDAISMAKSLGGGYPIGAFWVAQPHTHLLDPGSHGTTYGGNPLGCAVSLAILDTIRKENLPARIIAIGHRIRDGLAKLKAAGTIAEYRGMGCIIGIEIEGDSLAATQKLIEAGLLVIPSGAHVVRLLPAYNTTDAEIDQALALLETTL